LIFKRADVKCPPSSGDIGENFCVDNLLTANK